MRLAFIVEGWPADRRDAVLLALWQLAPRLGLPFLIASSSDAIPSETVLVSVSPEPSQSSSQNTGVPFTLGDDRLLAPSPAQKVDAQTQTLWSVGAPDAPGLFAGLLELVTFEHERSVSSRSYDKFGRIYAADHPLACCGLETVQLIENNAAMIAQLLSQHTGVKILPPDPWGANRAALVLTHDVDGPRLHAPFALARSGYLGHIRGNRFERASFDLGVVTRLFGGKDPYWNFEDWLEIERSLGTASTFFFYARARQTYRHAKDPRYDITDHFFDGLFARIEEAGGEVGLHTSILGCKTADIKASTQLLIRRGAHAVTGCRSHYWAIDWRDPAASWREMQRGGIAYDLSLSPLQAGYRNGTALPMLPLLTAHGDPHPFTVTPTAIMDYYTLAREVGLPQRQIDKKLTQIIESTRRHRGVLVLDWHERTLANAGRWRGYLAKMLEIVMPLADNSDWRPMTAHQLHTEWLAYVKRLWIGPKRLPW